MKLMTFSRVLAAMLAAALFVAFAPPNELFADERHHEHGRDDHDRAFRARQGGSVLPLAKILSLVRTKIDGEIIETEFKYERGIPVYEFKYVNGRGQVRELYADARNGAVLKDKPD